jgi:glycosyltransferase involved in cell wall biosynthesis
MKKSIKVDASWFGMTGIGRVAKEVLSRCPNDWDVQEIRANEKNAGIFTPLALSRKLVFSDADIFWSPGFMPPVIRSGIPTVITIHDLTHLHFYSKRHIIYYNSIIKKLLRNVNHVITVSDYTRKEFIEWSGVGWDKITRIYNAVGADFTQAGSKYSLGKPYVLYVGNRRYYKNVLGLMRAFKESGLAERGFLLALSGEVDSECSILARELKLDDSVVYLGFIPEKELYSVYRGAHALAFVSLYEGFGLPILEAMASGIPVLTSIGSSMSEVAGGAALLVDPNSVQSIASGLQSVCLDYDVREKLINLGLGNAMNFSWDKTAKQYWDLFENIVNSARGGNGDKV